jgi:hypothetical protein
VAAAECFEVRRRVHVGDWDRRFTADAADIGPAGLHVVDGRHIGHRAAGGQVRQDYLLVGAAENVGALRHEMHAAEQDVLGVATCRRQLTELERIAPEVGKLDDLVALIVVAEDDQPVAELALVFPDLRCYLFRAEPRVGRR